jgi:hypothetical protein
MNGKSLRIPRRFRGFNDLGKALAVFGPSVRWTENLGPALGWLLVLLPMACFWCIGSLGQMTTSKSSVESILWAVALVGGLLFAAVLIFISVHALRKYQSSLKDGAVVFENGLAVRDQWGIKMLRWDEIDLFRVRVSRQEYGRSCLVTGYTLWGKSQYLWLESSINGMFGLGNIVWKNAVPHQLNALLAKIVEGKTIDLDAVAINRTGLVIREKFYLWSTIPGVIVDEHRFMEDGLLILRKGQESIKVAIEDVDNFEALYKACKAILGGNVIVSIGGSEAGGRNVPVVVGEPSRSVIVAASALFFPDDGKIGDSAELDIGRGRRFLMRYVPGGRFTMGSPQTEKSRCDDEDEVEVELGRDFWMGEMAVTQGQWEAVMGNNPSHFKGDPRLPVEEVTWEDAQEFMRRLNSCEGLPAGWKWSLPTEAQWERACRGGTTTATAFGDSLSGLQANFNGLKPYGGSAYASGPYLLKTSVGGSYLANGYGLLDMHGNVWEWCEDCYRGRLPGGLDPLVHEGDFRVYRGGSWRTSGWGCRSAFRNWCAPRGRYFGLGFRLALVSSR